MVDETQRLAYFCSVASRYRAVKRLILFGSRSKSTAEDLSDYDIAVDWEEGSSPGWGAFCEEIRDKKPFLQQVDLVRLDRAGKALKERAIKEGKVIYEQDKANVSKL